MQPKPNNTSQLTTPPIRLAPSQEWIRAGFFGALGVALLALLAQVVEHFYTAIVAVALPFVLGAAFAWLLDPMVARLQRGGMPRIGAAGIVFGGLLVVLIGSGMLLVPAVAKQASNLAANVPEYTAYLKTNINPLLKRHHLIAGIQLPPNFNALASQLSTQASALVQRSFGSISAVLMTSVTLIIQIFLALIITFFLLLDLDRLRARLLYLAPDKWRGPMREVGRDVGAVFAEYIRGLIVVCSLYGAAMVVLLYSLSFFHHDLAKFALIVGITAGVLYLVPYVGSLASAVLTFGVASLAGGIAFGGLAVLLSLGVNQIFDNIVTPKVVGGGVGLHPVISIFALVLGGEMFGVWGMLLSVPVAASVQIILFRLFPKLTSPTPSDFLQLQNGRRPKGETPA